MDWHPEDSVVKIFEKIRKVTKDRRVLFFLSGGVDSTVAYALTVKALGADRVHGVYVDTGFMRLDETREIQTAFDHLGYGRVEVVAARGQFLSGLRDVVEPEKKRQIIGQAFVDVQEQVLEQDEFAGDDGFSAREPSTRTASNRAQARTRP